MIPARQQTAILASRYWACQLGDWPVVGLLLAQAGFIGWLCTLVWGSLERDTPSLWFVMSLSSVWFGCITSCREIVKERAILERERLFGLSLAAYVGSRFQVMAWLCLAQVGLFQLAIEWKLALHGPYLVETLGLWLGAMCGVGLGLVVSALARSQSQAVGAIPVLILPQILFSEFAISRDRFADVVVWVERLMPARWTYRVFTEAAALEPSWAWVLASLCILTVYAAALGGLTLLVLLPRREI